MHSEKTNVHINTYTHDVANLFLKYLKKTKDSFYLDCVIKLLLTELNSYYNLVHRHWAFLGVTMFYANIVSGGKKNY